VALASLGEYERAEQCAASCEAFATRLGDPLRTAASYFYQSVLAEMKFDWAMGVKYTTRLLSYDHEYGIGGLYLVMATMFAGRHQYHLGRLKRAEVLLLNALNLARVVGISMGVGWAHGFLGDVRFVSGRLAAARESYSRGLEIGNAGGRDEYAAGLSLIGLAHCAGQAGQASEARLLLDEGLRRLEDAGLLGDAAERFRALEKARFDALGITPCAWRPEVLEEASTASVEATSNSAPGEKQSLLETLSTIDGVIPGFANSHRM
jgi:tetratricopeptide (TPR) repeat protein